ncbi:FtsX-like permease family protein [Xanthomonas hyacinthi]|uniref:ABC transporter permease n=1 Tax=Xanthomonas hyacinthi TaxID=56455 RepID=A0A2S7EPF5_9XANT|nr:FtsX-like permease family protein [Xanthomonas hyacinthi]KLD79380.1 ABC transporter permease [Xanthomonas hyacinthi DSM 19077]PPU94389.1 ABC transporter permease [Xanthomonas hyacinthi]QGY76682.1 FtsX-like permease family protein [Xanthomonas hyacinthi]
MDIYPVLASLKRNKVQAVLIVLEIALGFAIVSNAVFMISQRLERMGRLTGMLDEEIVRINVGGGGDNPSARVRQDLANLREIPGVKSATSLNHVPFDNSSWNGTVNLEREQRSPTLTAGVYLGENLVDAFGLKIIEGRNFTSEEYVDWEQFNSAGANLRIPSVIITQEVARRLFPGESAVGKDIYSWNPDNSPHRVVGVVERLIRPNDSGAPSEDGYSMLLPMKDLTMGRFAIRTDPDQRESVEKSAVAALERSSAQRVILESSSFSDVIREYYRKDRSMAWLLVALMGSLLVVTALGIFGLTSFWVSQRTRQIGIRRALGATRGQVLRYFQTENFVLATLGIVIGMIGAYGINQVLMNYYELGRLPVLYLPVGAITLWLVGQLAVYSPARRATSVAPAVATRNI